METRVHSRRAWAMGLPTAPAERACWRVLMHDRPQFNYRFLTSVHSIWSHRIQSNPCAGSMPLLQLAGGPRLASFEASSHRSSCHLRFVQPRLSLIERSDIENFACRSRRVRVSLIWIRSIGEWNFKSEKETILYETRAYVVLLSRR